jgi:hypothetical protein
MHGLQVENIICDISSAIKVYYMFSQTLKIFLDIVCLKKKHDFHFTNTEHFSVRMKRIVKLL